MEEAPRPLILVTNDDGYLAPGIEMLTRVAMRYGDVAVVAPATPQSGRASAITVGEPLEAVRVESAAGVERWKVAGTPVDCVKLALGALLATRRPDLVLSGVNHGYNTGASVLYSGTIGAAFEALMHGLPAAAISYDDYDPQASLDVCENCVDAIVAKLAQCGVPQGMCLNINIPKITEKLNGFKITCPSPGYWHEEFDEMICEGDRRVFVMAGEYVEHNPKDATSDLYWLRKNFVSISPVDADQQNLKAAMQLRPVWETSSANGDFIDRQ